MGICRIVLFLFNAKLNKYIIKIYLQTLDFFENEMYIYIRLKRILRMKECGCNPLSLQQFLLLFKEVIK